MVVPITPNPIDHLKVAQTLNFIKTSSRSFLIKNYS